MTAIAHPLHTPAAPAPRTPRIAAARRWTAYILIALTVPFLAFDGVIKLIRIKPVVDGMAQLGVPLSLSTPLAVVLLSCLALYIVPRTAILGAILLTGYLGGAVATHVRVGDPLFSHALFPVYVGAMLWGTLYLRDARVRALIPFRGNSV